MARRTTNTPPKNVVRPPPETEAERLRLVGLADRARYVGNPQHKLNPGDFNLTPPACARPNKNLCDDAGIFTTAAAEALLKGGIREGLVSALPADGWPPRVWAVDATERVYEAKLDGNGTYHAYPLDRDDPLAQRILQRRASAR